MFSLPAPRDSDGSNVVGWRGTSTHHFTVQSAYDIQHGNSQHIEGGLEDAMKLEGSSQNPKLHMNGSV